MRLLHFKTQTGIKLGLKTESGIIDVAAASVALDVPDAPTTLAGAIEGGSAALQKLMGKAAGQSGAWLLDENSITFAPSVLSPEKIICVGKNYADHAAETGSAPPTTPILFSKFNNALAAHNETIPLPSGISVQFDYEAELVVVIGKTARDVPEAQALDYVFGYTTSNDISCRDLQLLTGQWLLGKTLDKFLPVGPYLLTADEVADPQNLDVKLWLNGDLRQSANTSSMIFSIKTLISYASRHFTLKPGDIISTGTPEGVILGTADKIWMKAGDKTEIEIAGQFGRLVNVMG